MNTKNNTTNYIRGHKGSRAAQIFFKGALYLLINQIVFFGASTVFFPFVQNASGPAREIVEYLDEYLQIGEAYAAGEVEFVSIVDPDNGAGTDYTSLASWESSIQIDLTAASTKVIAGSLLRGSISDGTAVTQTTSAATATVAHATATQMLVSGITGTPNATDTWYPTADGSDVTNAWTPTDAGNPAIAVAKCRSTSGTADTIKVAIDGWTTSATNYIKIYTDPEENYRHAGTYNTSKYRIEATASANDEYLISINENYVRIEGLQLQITNSGSFTGIGAINMDTQTSPSGIVINNSILKGVISGVGSWGIGIVGRDADLAVDVYNNIIYDFNNGSNNVGIATTTGGTYNLYNNTLADNSVGINVNVGTVVAKNNLVMGSGDTSAYSGTFAVGTDYNATDGTDAIGQGSNNRINQTFSFVNSGSDDFHLASGDTGAKDVGTSSSGPFTDDIDGETRIDAWDIGADEQFTPWTTLTQRAGIIENDVDGANLTAHTAKIGERIRVKLQVDTNGNGLAQRKVLKLQYDKDSSGTWIDVAPSAEIRAAVSEVLSNRYATGAPDAGACFGGTIARGAVLYEGTAVTKADKIYGGACQEFGFTIDTKNATANTTYRFRLYNVTDNAVLTSYVAYPSFATITMANDTQRFSKSNSNTLPSAVDELVYLLDDLGYTNINAEDIAHSILQNVAPMDATPHVTLNSETEDSAGFGVSVASAGDVNGDGYPDIIVGANVHDNGGTDRGRAYIFYGGIGMDITPDVILSSEIENSAKFGVSVASAGDVNGDGYADVIVGAHLHDNGGTDRGRAYIFYGGSSMDATADVTLNSETENGANFGGSVASAGDVNGDGYADVIVGAHLHDNGGTDRGRAYIFYGGSSMDTAVDVTLNSETEDSALFGYSVASAGDVNGDGYADVIVGAYQHDNGAASSNRGRAYVFYGGTGMDATPDVILDSETQAIAFFGSSVASAGDVNGDGYSDVIVGAWRHLNGGSQRGRAYLFYGGTSLPLTGITPDVTLDSEIENGAAFGFSVASAGDVNGDGYADVIVGANLHDNGGTDRGRAYIFYGGTSMDATVDVTLNSETQDSARFGNSVASAGDVNGDGYADVLVGANLHDNGGTDRGRAYIIYGGATIDTAVNLTLDSETENSTQFGHSIASAGDVNGDGYADVIVGANLHDNGGTDRGRAYIFYGGTSMDATVDVTLNSETEDNARFGRSVASAGDVNGDGYADVIVGANLHDNGGTDRGRAYIFYGGTSMDAAVDVTLNSETEDSARFGNSVASAGDVNGDGYADVIVGATGHDNGGTDRGRAYIFYGGTSMDAAVDVTLNSETENGAQFGHSVASSGDVNGDGYADVIVGAHLYDNGGTDRGRAYIFYGGTSMDATADVTLNSETQDSARFGNSVASAGDVNGDGYSDVIIGADLHDNGGTDRGRAYIFYGGTSMDAAVDVTLNSETENGAQFGHSVASSGDANGDGYADVIVGARLHDNGGTDRGRAYFFAGGASNAIPTFTFAGKHTVVCSGLSSIDATWIGQTSVAASVNNKFLQVYRFGSTNAWETADTDTTCAMDIDCTLDSTGWTPAGPIGEYCDGSNWSYWRLYQDSGVQTIETDFWSLAFTDTNIPTIDNVVVSSINGANDTITITFSEPMDTTTITAGINTLVIKYADDTSGTNEVVIPTANATVVWSGGDTIATITLDGS